MCRRQWACDLVLAADSLSPWSCEVDDRTDRSADDLRNPAGSVSGVSHSAGAVVLTETGLVQY